MAGKFPLDYYDFLSRRVNGKQRVNASLVLVSRWKSTIKGGGWSSSREKKKCSKQKNMAHIIFLQFEALGNALMSCAMTHTLDQTNCSDVIIRFFIVSSSH
jgi:hypothetical protein